MIVCITHGAYPLELPRVGHTAAKFYMLNEKSVTIMANISSNSTLKTVKNAN